MSRLDSLSMAAGVLHQVGRKAKPIAIGVARRGQRAPAERPKSLARWDSMTSRSRGGMRAFRGRPMQPPVFEIPPSIGNEVLHLDGAIGYGKVGEGRSRVYRREWLLSQNQSIHEAKLHSGMEKEEKDEEEK